MKKIEEMTKEFLKETSLRVAEPLVKATKSWMYIEDTGNATKATELNFAALKGKELYMTSAEGEKSDYVKLYIAVPRHTSAWSLYIERYAVCPGESYHRVT